MTEEEIRQRLARNLAYYRKQLGLTQTELSERINYSDKSVSKWERGEGVPDVYVLVQLAQIFGLTVDGLLADGVRRHRTAGRRQRLIVTTLATGIAWLVAALSFVLLSILMPEFHLAWLTFIWAVPASGIVLLVFSCLWWNNLVRFLSVSLVEWGAGLSVQLTLSLMPVGAQNVSRVYIFCAVLQLLTLLWYILMSTRKKNRPAEK